MSSILLLTITTTSFTKAQKRWRIACTAIHFTLYLARDIVPEKRSKSSIAQKRWRLAYTVIYSIFPRHSLSHFGDCTQLPDRHSHPSPHTIVEIEQIIPNHGFDQTTSKSHLLEIDDADDADDSFFPDIDQSKLTEMVKEKDLNELSKFGGIKGLTKALRTDPENGISGNDDDFTLQKSRFGTHTSNKPPPKGLLHFVVEAFKDTTIIILLGCAVLSPGFGIKEHGGKEGWYEGGSIFVANGRPSGIATTTIVTAAATICTTELNTTFISVLMPIMFELLQGEIVVIAGDSQVTFRSGLIKTMIGYDLLDFNNGMRRRVTAVVWRFGYNLRNERENGAGRAYHRVDKAPSLLSYTGFAPLLRYDISGEIKREVNCPCKRYANDSRLW
ncbi:hypothetical protein RHSIM_Rhsim13G0030600 [Rhododendron simsii]|uniref:Cation-transporting P-type ATPase N-terminal domain-containing protein n=1 Tax=Rhododendron simsii TaxID=118357 RepID=A0A834L3I1_RHOSS|nr:hypothetical protein RHSIM_Rhsim13G0030600 [Rhododendron simsii]